MKNINQKIYEFILNNKLDLINKISYRREFYYKLELEVKHKNDNYKRYTNDISHQLTYLSEAINLNSIVIYIDYITWSKSSIQDANISAEDININLNCMREILNSELSKEMNVIVNSFIDAAIKNSLANITISKTSVDKNNTYYDILVEYIDLLLNMKRQKASRLIIKESKKGTPIKDIYVYIFEPALKELGRLWQIGKVTITQEVYFTATTQLIMTQLYPIIFASPKNGLKFVGSCIDEENHEIGIRMVSDILELDGWDTYFFGSNVSKNKLLNFITVKKPNVLAISITMTFNVNKVIELIYSARNIKEINGLKILVGGYPFNEDKNLWKQVGADFYAPNAIETSELLSNAFKCNMHMQK